MNVKSTSNRGTPIITGPLPKVLEFMVPYPPRELLPNQDKPGPNWTFKAWKGQRGDATPQAPA